MTGGAGSPDLEALDLVSRVCGRVAHDLNNLLAAVDGYAEFVAGDVADRPQVLADITEVRNAARKGAAFTRRLRQVGQLNERNPEPTDISRLVHETEEQVRLAAGEGVACEFRLAEGLPPVEVDQKQLELALLSVVENACEAMPDGGRLTVETAAAGEMVALRVTDTGAGMPPEVVEKLCQPFFSTKPKAIGNGLGMFIVDGVVRGAGGRTDVSSEVGEGTTVTLLLPAAPAA